MRSIKSTQHVLTEQKRRAKYIKGRPIVGVDEIKQDGDSLLLD
jgi:hypothetical protein